MFGIQSINEFALMHLIFGLKSDRFLSLSWLIWAFCKCISSVRAMRSFNLICFFGQKKELRKNQRKSYDFQRAFNAELCMLIAGLVFAATLNVCL